MHRCYRFIGTLIIAVILSCCVMAPIANAAPIDTKQITVSDVFKLGVEKMWQGDYQGAIAEFTQAIQIKGNFASAYSNRCLAYLQLQDYQNAVSDCTQAIKISPDNTEAYLNRGLAYSRQGNYQAAIADNNQVIAIHPQEFRAYYNRGVANAYLGNHQQATKDYNLALSYNQQIPNNLLADIHNDRGLAYLELAELETAILAFNQAITLDGSNYRIYFNRGCAHAQTGNYWDAVNDFSQVVQLNPQNGDAYLNRGIAYHNLGYEQTAISDLHQAVAYFELQGEKIAYEKTLNVIKSVQQQIPDKIAIAMAL
ncbi:tetratricopeptide repeat protein [Calothrix rhizosoleniae]|uniref:tetratricopeptide repeat protein n=1 Tax=Calothrix rhizosoleniae TaxID=888997 RepID=UPI000B4A33BB|nr:tetratricopeptide repeat protein [Calothrix rhizosoleniae]